MDFPVSLIIFISLLLRSDANLADAFVGSVLAYFLYLLYLFPSLLETKFPVLVAGCSKMRSSTCLSLVPYLASMDIFVSLFFGRLALSVMSLMMFIDLFYVQL